jgi:choline kinase
MRKISVVIPAAGQGRRMKSLKPKMLIELGYHTVITRQICMIRNIYPSADITVVVGFAADMAIAGTPLGVKVVENEHYEDTNVVRSIDIGMRVADSDNILIIYGDLVFNTAAIATMTGTGSAVLMDSKRNMRDDEVGGTVINGYINTFSYGIKRKWAQIAYLTGSVTRR